MISYCRNLDVLSNIVILFLIGGLELFFADINGFLLKMIFAAAEDIDIVILLAVLLGLLTVNKPITLVNSKIAVSGLVIKF